MNKCLECKRIIEYKVLKYSKDHFGFPLCRKHQRWIRYMESQSSHQCIELYLNLKERGIPAHLEKFDGFKSIDIAIPKAKLNIEVDGKQHCFNEKQALSDLGRTYHSLKKGFYTIRIPNVLLDNNHTFEKTINLIFKIYLISLNEIYG